LETADLCHAQRDGCLKLDCISQIPTLFAHAWLFATVDISDNALFGQRMLSFFSFPKIMFFESPQNGVLVYEW
jgi:hypothetical protein